MFFKSMKESVEARLVHGECYSTPDEKIKRTRHTRGFAFICNAWYNCNKNCEASNMLEFLANITLDTNKEVPERPALDMGMCEKCGWKGSLSACETEHVTEDWETGVDYVEYLCPECDEGIIDDFWPSDASMEAFLAQLNEIVENGHDAICSTNRNGECDCGHDKASALLQKYCDE